MLGASTPPPQQKWGHPCSPTHWASRGGLRAKASQNPAHILPVSETSKGTSSLPLYQYPVSRELLLLEQALPLNIRVGSMASSHESASSRCPRLAVPRKIQGPHPGHVPTVQRTTCHQMVRTRWQVSQCSPVLERGGGGGLAELATGTESDLYRAVSRRSLKRSAAIRALDSSCRGMLLMSEEKGLSGFSRLISQLVFPGEGRQHPSGCKPMYLTSHPLPALPA